MTTLKLDAILDAAERELTKASRQVKYEDEKDKWTAALRLVQCARLHLMPRDNDPLGALQCCESAIKLAVLGDRQFFGDIPRAIIEAANKLNEAIIVLGDVLDSS